MMYTRKIDFFVFVYNSTIIRVKLSYSGHWPGFSICASHTQRILEVSAVKT